MAGLIAIVAGIILIVYAVQHDKKDKENKWLGLGLLGYHGSNLSRRYL